MTLKYPDKTLTKPRYWFGVAHIGPSIWLCKATALLGISIYQLMVCHQGTLLCVMHLQHYMWTSCVICFPASNAIRRVYAQRYAKETRSAEWSGHNLTPNACQGILHWNKKGSSNVTRCKYSMSGDHRTIYHSTTIIDQKQ